MKTVKKALALLLVMAMVVSMFSGITAHAEGSLPMTLTAEREGDNVVLKLTLTEEMNFGGMGGSISFDSEAFTLSSITSDVLNGEPNINTGAFSMDTSADLTLPAGALLATFTFAVGEAYAAGEEYSFSIELDELYDFKLTDYDCSLTTETTFQEEAEEPAEPELTLSAERDGDYVLLKLMTVGDLNLGGMNIQCGWDTDVFSCADDDVTSDILDVTYGNRILLLDTSSNLTVPDGTVICTMKLAIGEAYVQGEEYSFTMTFDELYDFKTHDYAFTGETITAILQEEAPAQEFEVELTARREGDNLLVELKALTDFNLGGMRITYNYDDAAFGYSSFTANKGLGVVDNPITKKATFDSGNKIEFSAGEVVATLTLTFEEGFQYDTTYTFTMYFDEAYNYSFIDLLCNEETVSATYMEEGKYTVTWVNYDGTELEVDENVTSGTTPSYDGAEPTRSDDAACAYTFAGWDPEPAPVTKDVTYTATFEAKDHEWEFVDFTWTGNDTDGYTAAVANYVCKNNAAHTMTADAGISTETVEATCEEAGKTVYTATVNADGPDGKEHTDTKEVAIPALGHQWEFDSFEWTGNDTDGYTAVSAKYFCLRDENHTTSVEASLTVDETEAACTEGGKIVYTATIALENSLDEEEHTESKTVDTDPIGHDWGEVTYVWAEDNSTVTATRVCKNNEAHVETETVNTASEITKPATCEEAGETTYTATFENAAFETQTKVVNKPEALNHDWEFTGFTWTGDDENGYTAAVANYVCKNDETHTRTVEAKLSVDTTDATCTEPGEVVYTATVDAEQSLDGKEHTDSKTVAAVALGHKWAFVDFTWTETADGFTAVANYKCENDETHTQSVNATVTSETTDATCEADGKTVYTATVAAADSLDKAEHSDTKEVTIPALGHKWAFVDFTWTETADGFTAVANYKCENDETHTQTVNATVSSETTDATCTENGKTVFTATVTADKSLDGTAHTDTKEEMIPATGHDWEFVDFTWTETADGFTAVANYKCKNDETHIVTAEAMVWVVEEEDPTCEEPGAIYYLAEIEGIDSPDGQYHDENKTVAIPATGHDWEFVDFTWTGDDENGYTAAVANYKCKNDETHTQTVNATLSAETTDATCEADGKTVYTATVAAADSLDKADHSDTKEVIIPATGHDWDTPTYTWADDNSEVTAEAVCKNDATHKVTETVETTSEITHLPTCEEPGATTYTAEFDTPIFETQTKTVEGPAAFGHDWEFVDFTWTGDDENGYTAAAANYKCKNDNRHKQTVAATLSTETTDATCEADGKTVYTATVDANAALDGEARTDTKEVTIPALGHDWAFVDFTWTETADGWTAVANYVCRNDETHTQTVNATVTSETIAATCEADGKTVYTAAVDAKDAPDGEARSDTKEVTIPAIGHDWTFVDFTWTETADGWTAVANYKCENDETHTQSVNATVTSETTDATCEADGKTVYTATVAAADSLDKAEHSDTKEVTIPALGHEWSFAGFKWYQNSDGTLDVNVIANFKCKHDASHTTTLTVTASVATTEATCEEQGKIVYTVVLDANTSLDGNEYTDTKTIVIPAIGHDWAFVDFTWTETADGFTAVANYKCGNDETHTQTVNATVTSETTDATCEADGKTVYTATVAAADSLDKAEHSDTKEVIIKATGHDWGEPEYTWVGNDEDGYEVTAVVVCKNDETHTITETVTATYEVVTAPTTEAEGLGRYTATFTKEPFTTQTRDVTLAMIGYHIIVDDYTKGGATTSLVADKLYDGEVDFTVSAELACSVGILNEDGTITRVNCTDVDGEHHFKVTVDGADLHLVLVYKGDADLNAVLELKDSTRIKRTMVDLMTMTELEMFAADADADGQMLGKDATLIARYMVDLDEIIWGVATRGRVA